MSGKDWLSYVVCVCLGYGILVRLGWVKRCIRIVPVRLWFVLLRCVSSFSVILDSCERKNR